MATLITDVKFDGTRQPHDLLANLLSKWLLRAKVPHTGGVGGFKRAFKGPFTEFANQLPEPDPNNPAHVAALRYRQGIIPGLVLDLASIDFLGNVA